MLDARDLPDGQKLSADVCIVGAGAAGIAMALEFIGTGLDVLMIESGGAGVDRENQDLNLGAVVDDRLHGPLEEHRRRHFGGSFNARENRCTPFAAVDFECRSHVANSGWPFTLDTLQVYYERAQRLCESDESARSYERDHEAAKKPLWDNFASANFDADTVDRYGISADFGITYGSRLRAAANVCVLMHATVTRLHLNSAGTTVDTATTRTLSGKSVSINADCFVLAGGGLETARLLLANRDVQGNGIGNDHNLVGRHYMCPVAGTIGLLTLAQPALALWHGQRGSETGMHSRRIISLKAKSQDQQQIGNFAARLRDRGRQLTGKLLQRRHSRRREENLYSLDFRAEQQPSMSSRVSLGEDRDALGMPRLVADWNCNVADFETIRRSLDLFAEDLERSGAGVFRYDPAELAGKMTCRGAHGHHHLGTARMGNDPGSSVVDANCRIHGMTNLYLAGSAVFPTSGAADPMLTLIALTLRLADHLKRVEFALATEQRHQSRLAEINPGQGGPLPVEGP